MSLSNLTKPKSKAQSLNQRCPNSMPACGESACFYINNKDNVFLVNDPFSIKSWHQSFNLDDMPSFTTKLHYHLQRDFVDKIHDAYLNGQS